LAIDAQGDETDGEIIFPRPCRTTMKLTGRALLLPPLLRAIQSA
jgi:hypothetical protein